MNSFQLSISNYPRSILPGQLRSVEEILGEIKTLDQVLQELQGGLSL